MVVSARSACDLFDLMLSELYSSSVDVLEESEEDDPVDVHVQAHAYLGSGAYCVCGQQELDAHISVVEVDGLLLLDMGWKVAIDQGT